MNLGELRNKLTQGEFGELPDETEVHLEVEGDDFVYSAEPVSMRFEDGKVVLSDDESAVDEERVGDVAAEEVVDEEDDEEDDKK